MWNLEVMEQLLKEGFELCNGVLIRNRGSIANYSKVKICEPRVWKSIDEKDVLVCYIEEEEFTECGYFEADHQTIRKFYAEESKLVSMFATAPRKESNHVRTRNYNSIK